MSPIVALSVCLACVAVAYWVNAIASPGERQGLWAPLIWMLILSSRPANLWLSYMGASPFKPDPSGNPLDAAIYTLLIVLALRTLSKRHIDWAKFRVQNVVLVTVFAYMAVSVLWADEPLTSAKRFIKIIGTLIMVLVIITHNDPVFAIQTVSRRAAYLLVPLSEILNKYFDSVAISYDAWSGAPAYCGVADSKNMLGQLCFVFALILSWTLISDLRAGYRPLKKIQLILDGSILGLAVYLLMKSDSATSKICFCLGLLTFFAARFRFLRWRMAAVLIAGIIVVTLYVGVDVRRSVTSALHRDTTLTSRTDIWNELWKLRGNFLIGTGFDGFWSGNRLTKILEKRHINEAHNGYLEVFLNLGAVGLALWLMLIGNAYRNCKRLLQSNYDFGCIAMALFAAIMVYNFTEAGFRALTLTLFFFLVIAIDTYGIFGSDSEEELSESFEWADEPGPNTMVYTPSERAPV